MEAARYGPKLDKLYRILLALTSALCLPTVIITALSAPLTLTLTLPVTLFAGYFFVSPLFGYVELRQSTVFIKYGFFLKKEIAYSSIRSLEIQRRFYSDSMLSLKQAMEHINIKYARFDITSVSVTDNRRLLEEIEMRRAALKRF